MCTLVILYRPGHGWPLLLAGNRDERRDRPWRSPARHWQDRPQVVAGLDELAGGSWFGVNDDGVVAVVMNRAGTLGPVSGKRSRGELVLEALDHSEAPEATHALGDLDTRAYRAFNLFIGDPDSAFWLRHGVDDEVNGHIDIRAITPGLHMLTAYDLDDAGHPRIRDQLPRFHTAAVPDPDKGDWEGWRALLGDRSYSERDGPYAPMNLDLPDGFGTVCSHLLAIPRYPGATKKPQFLFAAGPPDRAPFLPVAL